MIKVGVLSLQGDVSEHVSAVNLALEELHVEGDVIEVKTREGIRGVDALIIPGGESTTLGKLLEKYGMDNEIKRLARTGAPVMGTCAGLILLGNTLGLMDIRAGRNAFGRQRESFEADLEIPKLGKKPYHAVFIRAPVIEQTGGGVEVLARYEEKTVIAQQDNLLAVAFHPELTSDTRLHRYFLGSLKR